jgi:hypothetical protein
MNLNASSRAHVCVSKLNDLLLMIGHVSKDYLKVV